MSARDLPKNILKYIQDVVYTSFSFHNKLHAYYHELTYICTVRRQILSHTCRIASSLRSLSIRLLRGISQVRYIRYRARARQTSNYRRRSVNPRVIKLFPNSQARNLTCFIATRVSSRYRYTGSRTRVRAAAPPSLNGIITGAISHRAARPRTYAHAPVLITVCTFAPGLISVFHARIVNYIARSRRREREKKESSLRGISQAPVFDEIWICLDKRNKTRARARTLTRHYASLFTLLSPFSSHLPPLFFCSPALVER